MLRANRAPFAAALLTAATLCSGGCTDPNDPPVEEGTDLAVRDAAAPSDQAAPVGDAPAPRTALFGQITRTARPKNGGKGDLFVAVFEGNPVIDAKNARLLGQQLIPSVDFTDDKTTIPYRIEAIQRAQREVQVLAFLDDNHTTTAMNPAPDAGDPVTLDGLGGIKIQLTVDADNHRDLVLNAIIPSL